MAAETAVLPQNQVSTEAYKDNGDTTGKNVEELIFEHSDEIMSLALKYAAHKGQESKVKAVLLSIIKFALDNNIQLEANDVAKIGYKLLKMYKIKNKHGKYYSKQSVRARMSELSKAVLEYDTANKKFVIKQLDWQIRAELEELENSIKEDDNIKQKIEAVTTDPNSEYETIKELEIIDYNKIADEILKLHNANEETRELELDVRATELLLKNYDMKLNFDIINTLERKDKYFRQIKLVNHYHINPVPIKSIYKYSEGDLVKIRGMVLAKNAKMMKHTVRVRYYIKDFVENVYIIDKWTGAVMVEPDEITMDILEQAKRDRNAKIITEKEEIIREIIEDNDLIQESKIDNKLLKNSVKIEKEQVNKYILILSDEEGNKLVVFTYNDKARELHLGDIIEVTGFLRLYKKQKRTEIEETEIILQAYDINNVKSNEEFEIDEEREQKIKEFVKKNKDRILEALAELLEITEDVEIAAEAAILALVSKKEFLDDARMYAHTLIIGDQGLGKSRILKRLATALNLKIIDATNATAQGLKTSVETDEFTKQRIIRAGLLIRNHKRMGILFDELDKTSDKEFQQKLHTAMSIGKVTVAKAGIYAEFDAWTSIIATANAEKDLRCDKHVLEQVAFSKTFLDRFDYIVAVRSKDILNNIEESKKIVKSLAEKLRNKKARISTEEKLKLLHDILYYVYHNIYASEFDEKALELLNNFIKYYKKQLLIQGVENAFSHRHEVMLFKTAKTIAELRLKEKIEKEDVLYAIKTILKFKASLLPCNEQEKISQLLEQFDEDKLEESAEKVAKTDKSVEDAVISAVADKLYELIEKSKIWDGMKTEKLLKILSYEMRFNEDDIKKILDSKEFNKTMQEKYDMIIQFVEDEFIIIPAPSE